MKYRHGTVCLYDTWHQLSQEDAAPHAGKLVVLASNGKKATFEFMSSEFGGLPDKESLEGVLADPLDACYGKNKNREQGACTIVRPVITCINNVPW